VRLLVGYPPVGANDIVARLVAAKLSETLGGQVVVENKAGANGLIAGEAVAKAAPDGYTLMMAGLTPLVLNALTYPKIPYDPVADFTALSAVASGPVVVAVRPDFPVRNLQELAAAAKAQPGKIDFATVGTGGSTRVFFELLKASLGVDLRFVPYKGAAPAITDLLGGQVHGIAVDLAALHPFIKQGKLRGLAITSEARNALLPELRTVVEQGVPDMMAGNWYGVLGPARLPRPIVEKLHGALVKAVQSADFKAQLLNAGLDPMSSATPEAFAPFVRSELARWGRLVKAANVQAE
jgi:hypothetical protein